MIESLGPSRIGIDGGGTSCRVALLWQGQRFEARTGPANVTSDRNGALGAIAAGLAQVAQMAGQEVAALHALPAYAGLAGVTGPDVAAEVTAALPFENLTVEDDRRAAVIGALRDRDGAVAGIGTGSFVACQTERDIRFAGGYGLVLGDEASGAWLGKALLARVLHCQDGLAADSPLIAQIRKDFSTPDVIIHFAAKASPADFASLTPRLLETAAAGDATACDLMRAGAEYLHRALRAVGWHKNTPLCLLGGIATHYTPFLPTALAQAVTPPLGSALDGALTLAAGVKG